jgi:flagellar protein FlbD
MIEVTRLNGSIYFLNADMILSIEKTPDTVITLNSGDKLLARESPETLVERFVALKQQIYGQPPLITSNQLE